MATRLGVCLWCSIAAYLACASGALAQAPVRKIRQKMTDTLNGTGDFVCSVSIERTERMGKGKPPAPPRVRYCSLSWRHASASASGVRLRRISLARAAHLRKRDTRSEEHTSELQSPCNLV